MKAADPPEPALADAAEAAKSERIGLWQEPIMVSLLYRLPRTNEKSARRSGRPLADPCPVGALTRTVRKFQNCGLGDNSVTRYSKLAPGDRLIEVTWELPADFQSRSAYKRAPYRPKYGFLHTPAHYCAVHDLAMWYEWQSIDSLTPRKPRLPHRGLSLPRRKLTTEVFWRPISPFGRQIFLCGFDMKRAPAEASASHNPAQLAPSWWPLREPGLQIARESLEPLYRRPSSAPEPISTGPMT